jgi:hypothetical protein
MSIFKDIVGAGMNIVSDENAKKVGGKVKGASDKVEKSPAKRWSYKAGEGDGNTKERMGPMAQSLASVDSSVSDGKNVDGIAMLGLHHAAIGEQGQRLKRIEKKLDRAVTARA